MVLGSALGRARPSATDPPALLAWTGAPLEQALDVVGDIELNLQASSTATDTAWIVTLQDVAPDGTVVDVTAGWLRASLRRVDRGQGLVAAGGAPALAQQTGRVGIGNEGFTALDLRLETRRLRAL